MPIRSRFTLPIVRCSLATLLALLISPIQAQSADSLLNNYSPVSEAELRDPAPQDWLMWRRTYDLGGHSPLDQINRGNVGQLTEAWSVPLGQGGNMTTPLIHDGVMFIADTNNLLLALDARTGEELWRYQHDSENFDGRRIGVALIGDRVIVPHNDLDVVALNARTGAVEWEHQHCYASGEL